MPFRGLVLSGGNALGSYLAGAYEALHEAGETPDWIAGTSIGAITAGLIAGGPADTQMERLHEFWRAATAPEVLLSPWAGRWLVALQTRLLGRPALFHPRVPLPGTPERSAFYDATPMRRCLEKLIDLSQLNSGRIRVSVLAVDVQTSEEVVFDTATMRLTVDHLMASAALIPDFSPVCIDDRWLADGSLAANLPVDLILGTPGSQDGVCYLVDLFARSAAIPQDLATLSMRQSDVTFACQTERTLRALATSYQHAAVQSRVDVVQICHAAAGETAMKAWDFSAEALRRRWQAGNADMAAAIQRYQGLSPGEAGLRIHPPVTT
jgi:NTE family protein